MNRQCIVSLSLFKTMRRGMGTSGWESSAFLDPGPVMVEKRYLS